LSGAQSWKELFQEEWQAVRSKLGAFKRKSRRGKAKAVVLFPWNVLKWVFEEGNEALEQ
jgi:hypothetical protein